MYFKTSCGKLFVYNNGFYIQKNIAKYTKITEDEFKTYKSLPIKIAKFNAEVNSFFRNNIFKWTYDGVEYQNLDSFNSYSEFFALPTKIYKNSVYKRGLATVFHQGRIYLATSAIAHDSDGRLALLDYKTAKFCKYTQYKNCTAVYNRDLKCII
jgi:hypothetical protein